MTWGPIEAHTWDGCPVPVGTMVQIETLHGHTGRVLIDAKTVASDGWMMEPPEDAVMTYRIWKGGQDAMRKLRAIANEPEAMA